MIGFGAPALLVGALSVPLIVLALSWGLRRRRLAETRYAAGGLAVVRSGQVSPLWRGVKRALLLSAVALAVLSLARPQLGQTGLVLPREGSDVIIAIDVSRSMEVSDVKPARLDAAKQAAKSLVAHLGGDRVGLVAFAGSATLRFPLTTDDSAARQVIDGLAIGDSGVRPGTDIAEAVATGRGAFTGDKTRSKVIVLISDGEQLSGEDLAAAKAAADVGITLHTIGVGTSQGGEVAGPNPRTGQFERVIDPATGATAISRRDDANLRQLASAGQGRAYDGNGTDFAFDLSTAIDSLVKTQFNAGATTTAVERFQIPLALALALLIAESLVLESGAQVWQRLTLRRRTRGSAGARASGQRMRQAERERA